MLPPLRLSDAFRTRLDAFTSHIPGVADGRDDAVHGARVAVRRLREVVPLLGFEARAERKLSRRLRKITQRLGPLRELDVMCALIAECAEKTQGSSAVNAVGAAADRQRDEGRSATVKALSTKMERLALRLERACQRLAANEKRNRRAAATRAGLWALDARLVRRAKQLDDAIDRAACVYAPAQLHDVRIALKKFRYAAELWHDVEGRRAGADISVLKAGQDVLGRLHDLEGLIALARHVQASLTPPDLNTWRDLSRFVHSLEDECRQLHARFVGIRHKLLGIARRLTVAA